MDSNVDPASVDALLGSTLESGSSADYDQGISAAAGVVKTGYHQLHAFQNVMSYSMENVLRDCPRKFQIKKLEAGSKDGPRRMNNVTFAFGHAVGAGVAVYDQTRDLQRAIFAAFLAWDIDLLAEDRGRKPPQGGAAKYDPKKSFAFAVYALQKYATWYEEANMDVYEVVDIEATVAVDLELAIEDGLLQPTHYHTGHADEVLRHRVSGKLKVKENKTTAFSIVNPAMYANSNQGTGYSVIVDQYGETDYSVLYTIYSSTEQRWVEFEFAKNHLARIEWIRSEVMQSEQVQSYADANFFPKHGNSCFSYGRECEYFGMCDMNLDREFGMKFSELPVANMALLNQVEPFKYVVTRNQVVQSLRNKLRKE
jgi:hypothetical protein